MIPERDEPAWRAYEQSGFALATEVLKLEVALDAPPLEAAPPTDVTLRTYVDADAMRVRELLDDAYMGWDETYVPLEHDDWLAFMTEHDGFDPGCWFLADAGGELVGVCLTWKEGWIKDLAVAAGGARPRARRGAAPARVRTPLRARRADDRAQGRRPQPDERDPAVRACSACASSSATATT